MILFLAFALVARADTGEGAGDPAEDACNFAWQYAAATIVSTAPLAVDPCGMWEDVLFDGVTCTFTCTDGPHAVVVQ